MGSFLQMIAGLSAVLGAIAGAAWLARRCGFNAARPGSVVRLVSSQSLGPRERVVVVEIGDQWLVLGVSAGQVSRLSRMPRGDTVAAPVERFDFKKVLGSKLR